MPNQSIFPNPLFSGDAIPLVLFFWLVSPDPAASPPVVGVPRDLTGITVGCTIKVNQADSDDEAKYKRDLAGDTTGKISFGIPGLPAGQYWVDVKMWDDAEVRTPIVPSTQFSISQSITDRPLPVV